MARSSNNINVNYTITAETVRARESLRELQSGLRDLTTTPVNGIFDGTERELRGVLADVSRLRAALSQASNMKLGLLDFNQLSQGLKTANRSIQDYYTSLLRLGPQGQAVFNQLARSVAQAEVPVNRANAVLTNFFNTLKNNARWQLTSELVDGFVRGLGNAIDYAKDLDRSLNDIRIVSGQTSAQMAEFAVKAQESAKALSASTVDYTDASLIYYQQGIIVVVRVDFF